MAVAAAAPILTRESLNRAAPAATSPSNVLAKDDFLKLLVSQMKNQNPLEPTSNAEFMGQLAQFSTVDGVQQLNKSFADMLLLQQLRRHNLVGKTIVFDRPDSSIQGRGVVQSVKVDNGSLQLQVDGKAVSLSQIRSIESTT